MNKQTKAKRKLIGVQTLSDLDKQVNGLGVPLPRACKNLSIDLSRPVAMNLLTLYNADTTNGVIEDSMFPPWLPEKGVHTNPDNWAYQGRFPYGKWIIINE